MPENNTVVEGVYELLTPAAQARTSRENVEDVLVALGIDPLFLSTDASVIGRLARLVNRASPNDGRTRLHG